MNNVAINIDILVLVDVNFLILLGRYLEVEID